MMSDMTSSPRSDVEVLG